MNVVIFTDESGVKLPEIRIWKSSLGKGKDIDKDEKIILLLKKNSLTLPSNNIEFETKYREILHDYIRPAKLMFAGMFSEVREFKDCLSDIAQVSLYILSSRYGLLEEDELIIPYVSNITSSSELEALDERTRFSQKMLENTSESNIILLFLPSYFIRYLLSINWFSHLNPNSIILTVTSKHLIEPLSKYSNIKVLERKGVARIGLNHRDEILSLLHSTK